MATVNRKATPVNRVSGSPATIPLFPAASQPKPAPLTAAGLATLFHTLAKAADKEAIRDDLRAGSCQIVNATISGDIDGAAFQPLAISAVLTVGHDSQRASTVTPAVPHLIASILAKLNGQTRDAILRDLPNDFDAAGCKLPEVPAELIERTEAMLIRLRAKVSSPVRGSVSCKYSVGQISADAAAGATASH